MVRKRHHKLKECVYNATRRLGDGYRVILCQRVRGSVTAVRAVQNTRVFLTETRVVADEMLDRCELTDGRLLRITTDHAPSNYPVKRELQSTLDAYAIEWPALSNHIPSMAQVIQLALGVFMSSPDVKGRTKSWEAHECDRQFGQNESTDIGNSQRLQKEDNVRINKVSTMR